MDTYFLPISALQHYAYCPRQFALIHVEQAWEENYFTADGRRLHERVDGGEPEQRKRIRYERSVLLRSEKYLITGKMDLLEVHLDKSSRYFPIEYKRGKPKVEDWDRIQLCAQALCIEEMKETNVTEGAIWYWETRQRETILIDTELRKHTISIIQKAYKIRLEGVTPPPTEDKKRCRACSLKNLCQPDIYRNDKSANYIKELFADEKTS